MSEMLEDLEILILNNEDDFDRGKGVLILRKFIEEQKYKLRLNGVIRGADSFRSESVKRLEAFYDFGNQGCRYSNAELSRIMSCIDKIKTIPLYCV